MRTPVKRSTSTAAQTQNPRCSSKGKVTAFAGAGVLGPDPACRLGLHHRPAQHLPAGGEQRARSGVPGGLQPAGSGVAFGADPGGQGGQHRQPLPGPLVHPRLAPRPVLFVGYLAGTDRAPHRPRHPPGVVIGPLGDVEIHRPDRGQHVAAVQAGGHRGDGCPVGSASRFGLGHDALLPGGGDVTGKLQGGDAGMVGFQIGPEQLAEQVGQALQRGEVAGELAFGQVVDQHVADRLADDAVPVDQLLAGRLPAAREHPHRCGRIIGKAASVQELVTQRDSGRQEPVARLSPRWKPHMAMKLGPASSPRAAFCRTSGAVPFPVKCRRHLSRTTAGPPQVRARYIRALTC